MLSFCIALYHNAARNGTTTELESSVANTGYMVNVYG
jgi:hypothetical protein